MKKISLIFVLLVITSFLNVFSSTRTEKKDSGSLTVYAYDSFCGSYGPGNALISAFKEKTGIDVNLVECGSAVEMYNRIIYEGKNCSADVIIGLPDTLDIDSSLFYSFKPEEKESLIEYDESTNLVPFNYGVFAFLFNTESNFAVKPKSLEDLTKVYFRNSLLLIDPRTSSVGLGLLTWTIEALGLDNAMQWWEKMKENALTIADSWSSAYGLFTEREAPFVISYTTSPVYHMLNDGYCPYEVLEFTDGHIRTVEYLGILNTSKKKAEAEKFCNYLLTEGQEKIATDNSMFPANTKTELSSAFNTAPKIEKILNKNKHYAEKDIESFIYTWSRKMI